MCYIAGRCRVGKIHGGKGRCRSLLCASAPRPFNPLPAHFGANHAMKRPLLNADERDTVNELIQTTKRVQRLLVRRLYEDMGEPARPSGCTALRFVRRYSEGFRDNNEYDLECTERGSRM